jgi:hypothetical protein
VYLQVDVSSVTIKSSSVKQIISEENEKQIVVKTIVVDQIRYTPEPISEETMETTCGVGTKLVNGICKIIIPDDTKFCFLFWCW